MIVAFPLSSLFATFLSGKGGIYENPAEYPAIYGGDECGAGVRGMRSPSLPFIMPRFLKRGSLLNAQL
jgi:hypothetical protein